MYNAYNTCICPYYAYTLMYNPNFQNRYVPFANEMNCDSKFEYMRSAEESVPIQLRDYGPGPFVINIDEATKQNNAYRTALWTGKNLQITLMSINPGEDIGLEIHPNLDQFIRIEEGQGIIKMGNNENNLDFQREVYNDYAFVIPAGTWHNLINTGYKPIKLYSIYAPPQHPFGTVHVTKADAEAAEKDHSY